jgi:hypothetical protein
MWLARKHVTKGVNNTAEYNVKAHYRSYVITTSRNLLVRYEACPKAKNRVFGSRYWEYSIIRCRVLVLVYIYRAPFVFRGFHDRVSAQIKVINDWRYSLGFLIQSTQPKACYLKIDHNIYTARHLRLNICSPSVNRLCTSHEVRFQRKNYFFVVWLVKSLIT